MPTNVTSKGQVTIPQAIRERMGIVTGDKIDFEMAPDGRIVMVKVGAKLPPSKFEAMRGRAGPGMTTDEIMAMSRGEIE